VSFIKQGGNNMNRKIKRVVAIALATSVLSAITPMMNLNLITTKAYATTKDLTSIELRKSGGSSIQIYDDDDYKSKNEVDDNEINAGSTYYAKTSSKKVKIDTEGLDSKLVRIFKGDSSSTKGVKPGDTIELSSGSSKMLIIRTYKEVLM
jgi:hypothetical protein